MFEWTKNQQIYSFYVNQLSILSSFGFMTSSKISNYDVIKYKI